MTDPTTKTCEYMEAWHEKREIERRIKKLDDTMYRLYVAMTHGERARVDTAMDKAEKGERK